MMEVNWGHPVKIMLPQGGHTAVQNFTSLEQVQYWLSRKWPVADAARDAALIRVEAAMDCLLPVTAARKAFVAATESAGGRLL